MERGFRNKITTSFNWEEDEAKALEEISVREHKNQSKMIRRAIVEYINNHKSGNNAFTIDTWTNDPEFRAVPTYFSNIDVWIEYYKQSNEQDRTSMRIRAIELQKKFRMVDINE